MVPQAPIQGWGWNSWIALIEAFWAPHTYASQIATAKSVANNTSQFGNFQSAVYQSTQEIAIEDWAFVHMSARLTKCWEYYSFKRYTVHWKKIGELWTIRQNFLTIIHRYAENALGICTDFSLIRKKTFLANSFYLYGSPKISPAKIFLFTVAKIARVSELLWL